jgi:predicted transcriptional regulator
MRSSRWSNCCLISRLMFGGFAMKTVILDVRTPDEALADIAATLKAGKPQRAARISFATPELLWKVLTAKRWELLKALCGAGPVSIREAARRVGRDVKAVHTDATALLLAGVLDRTADGQIEFPYDAVKVEFLLQAA